MTHGLTQVHPAFEQLMDKNDVERARGAFDICKGTGVMTAVSATIALQPPTLVFPVGDFRTLQSCGWEEDGAPVAPLRTCRLCRAGDNARHIFAAEKAAGILGGELLGAELVSADADTEARNKPVALELDVPIGKGAWLLRLTTNRKPAQVWKMGATVPGSKSNKTLASVQLGDLRNKERRRGKG